MVWNWLRRHPRLVDALVVLGLAAAYVGGAAHGRDWHGNVPLALVLVAPLIFRRRYPLEVLAAVTAATAVSLFAFAGAPPIPEAFAVYTVAAQLSRRTSLRASGAAALLLVICALAAGEKGNVVGIALMLGAAWVVGDNLGTRRAYTRALEERAERLEREQEAERARAVAEEQARIARELHDVIAHSVSVMVVQAAAANDVFESQPARAREALEAIETSGRAALGELRRMLGVVRGIDDADYAPQPGVERIDELVADVRAAGLDVTINIEGAPHDVPAGVDLSVYRVVQEALTNTLKHARATRADVTLRYGERELVVEVRDNGTGAANGDGSGHGLTGMRERVAIFGGSLAAGPGAKGGFEVVARFPL
ncbi:MAG TPA: sensor histidine kinase [Gaiellaceae bacterium]|nr:sensor histidine kinase [Gaiellaceae bacterium]